MPRYRPNVALILMDGEGRMLVCERAGVPGAWQFPQGGVDRGESHEAALAREVEEEIGLPPGSYEVLESRGAYRYEVPPEVWRSKKKKKKWAGQEQRYYLCRLRPGAPPVNVDQEPREFGDFRWIAPEDFVIGWLPEFKREVYRAVMRDFFGVDL